MAAPLRFRYRRVNRLDSLSAVSQLVMVAFVYPQLLLGIWTVPLPRALLLGILLGGYWLSLRLLLGYLSLALHARNCCLELTDSSLHFTDWRGRTRELNWDDVALGMATAKVRILAQGQIVFEFGAREFGDGYTLVNELVARVRAAQARRATAEAGVPITRFPPGYFKPNPPSEA